MGGAEQTPLDPPTHAISTLSDPHAPQYYLQMSEPSEDESSTSSSDVEELPHRTGGDSREPTPEQTVAKPTPVFSSTVKDSKSTFAAAVKQARHEKEQRAAKAAADTEAVRKALQEQKHAFDASCKSAQPMQTPLKAKSAAVNETERSRVSAAMSASASASASASQRKSQPVPPTIPVVTSQAKTAAPVHSTLLEPPVMAPSATGLMHPEQCMSGALGGAMPPRRTMSRPKPVLAPVPTPPPMPVLSPRTPAASKDSLKTAPPPPPTKAAQTVPTAPSGSLPHAAVFHSAELPAPSSTKVTFAQKVRQLRLEKEAAAAAHGSSSPSSDEEEDEDKEGEGQRGSVPTPPGPPIHAISAAPDPRAPQYYLQLSEPSEDESSSTGSSDVEEVPHRAGGDSNSNGTAAAPNAEFVAFTYTRSSSGPQCPMLGFGMVCNPDGDTSDSLYLIVMVPEDPKYPVTSEFRMDPDEFITVQRQLVLARDLTFVDGGRGGVFDEVSQTKIRNVLNAYSNLQIDSHFL